MVGVVAYPIAELAYRKGWVTNLGAAIALGIFALGFWGAFYEVIEMYFAEIYGGESGAAFLGSQGDVWDAQKDMLLDILGAILVSVLFWFQYANRRALLAQPFKPAEITIGSDATPHSTQFDDIYFSADDGLAEARAVFLSGNDLPTNWQDKAQFIIAETGFGTGLNFLATWQAWRDDPKRPKNLFYVSVEKHPIKPAQLAQAHASWPELEDLSNELIKQLPPAVAGIHPLSFNNGAVQLLLVYDDIRAALKSLIIKADAWFLDGFCP